VRGEVYAPNEGFDAFNAAAEAEGAHLRQPAQFRRRLAAPEGSEAITAARPLRFFAYAWGETSAPFAKTQEEALAAFKAWGFKVNPRSHPGRGRAGVDGPLSRSGNRPRGPRL
jgi:DNA ligase (NAD+)